MKIIITGGSGFIGTNLLDYYLKKKYEVFNLDIKSPQNKKHKKYWYKINLTNFKKFIVLVKKIQPTHLIHLAAKVDLNGKKLKDYDSNIKSVKNIIELCKQKNNLKRVIFASSMLVNKTGYKPKNIFDYNPINYYGESKAIGEKIVLSNKNLSTDLCIIRPTSIWGQWFREPYKNFFDYVINERYFNPSSNTSKKTFGYVGNTIYQIDRLLFANSKKIRNKIFYVGDKPPVDISKWADEIAFLANVKKPKKIPLFIFKIIANLGDLITRMGISFPMTNYRLKNMTTDRVYNLDEIYNVCGNPPYSRKSAIKKTLKWLSKKKFKL